MNTRRQLAIALRKKLPRRYRIVESPRELDGPEAKAPVVQLIRTARNRTDYPGRYVSDVAVWVIAPEQFDEDALDDALDAVTIALDAYPWLTWDTAERSTALETFPAYRINTQIIENTQENIRNG